MAILSDGELRDEILRREPVDGIRIVGVEADPSVRLARGLARDGADHHELWRRWMREEAAFFAADGTRERADLRVDTSA